MINEIKEHLLNTISPFWENLKDNRGGFYGYVDFDLGVNTEAEKGVILNSRILWFFSNKYLLFEEEKDLQYAKHAYDFLVNYCLDEKYGGVFWMVDAKGNTVEEMKHTYNQAFAIYALSSFYEASGEIDALRYALDLFYLIEATCIDAFGYVEAFDRQWRPIDNNKLSDNHHLFTEGLVSEKTMNTLLHVLEAYTELYRVSKNNKVKEKLVYLLKVFKEKVYNSKEDILKVFFDKELRSITDMHSYGHDIEAAWLLDRACEVLKDKEITESTQNYTLKVAEKVRMAAFENGALNNERYRRYIDKTRIWWVQAEGIVGFINAYEKSGNKIYLDHARALWEYIKTYMIDPREQSEWFWQVDFEGNPAKDMPMAEPWKCPYHNGRMCFEVIRRNINV